MQHPPPEFQLLRLANAFQLSRAVQVAARLRLGRLLESGPKPLEELARLTKSNERMLLRFLRFLAELGIVTEKEDGFGPTPLSESLHLVDNIAQGEEAWGVWGALPEALRTGHSPFADVHGAEFYEYAALHPDQGDNWNKWNTVMGLRFFSAIVPALKLIGHETIVDVGGGEGSGLATILRQAPECRGVLLDLPQSIATAHKLFAQAGVSERATLVEGDALDQVPAGGDVYLVSRVLQNLGDQQASRLLERCRQSLGRRSRLLIIEKILPEKGSPGRRSLAASDLNHFLLWGGGHRTRAEMEALLEHAGLNLLRIENLPAQAAEWQLLEALPALPLRMNSDNPDG